MKVLTVAGFGVALIGIGVAVHGALSTALIAAGGAFVVASPLTLLLPGRGGNDGVTAQASDNASAAKTTGDNSPVAVSSGGPIDQSRTETHYYYGQERERAAPAIVFGEPQLAESTVKAPPQYPGSIGVFLVFQVANDPPPGVQCEAGEHVHASITVYDSDRNLLVSQTPARWQNKPQQAELGEFRPTGSADLREETLHPNGASQGIDSVVWLRREDEVYVWNQAGLGPKVKANEFIIELRVRGTNVDEVRSYRVVRSNNSFIGLEVTELGKVAAPPPQAPHPATTNPWSHAQFLQRRHELTELRKYLRMISEDELSQLNRPRLLALKGRKETSMNVATAQWSLHHEHLRAADDPRPYRAAGEAYRSLVDLSENLALEGRTQPLTDDEIAAVERTLWSVEAAIHALRQADSPAGTS
jgi:hypothetical protein